MRNTPSTIGDEEVAAARRVLPVFAGSRLTAMRELLGMAQAEVAAEAGISPAALSQAERGRTTLSAFNIAKVASLFGVSPDAFTERVEPEVALTPQFRHLRRTSVRDQRKAERFVHAAALVARILREEVSFPEPFGVTLGVDPDQPISDVAEQVERAAATARAKLGIAALEPVGSELIDSLESGGITVVRDPKTSADIDAYSAAVGQLAVIVLDGGQGSVWDRDNFNLAHELGHLVMHRGVKHIPGTRTVEAQAHRFAGAFLGPADALRRELPCDLDWGCYFRLKLRWGMSMVALVRRAKDLGVIDDSLYTRAMKQRSAYGWRRAEPGSDDRALPSPRLLGLAASLARMSSTQLAGRAGLPVEVVERIIGDQRPSVVVPLGAAL